jgi:hypothetical protein
LVSASMNQYLAIALRLLYYISIPFKLIYKLTIACLAPLYNAIQFLLLPATYFVQAIWLVLSFPFRANVLANVEVGRKEFGNLVKIYEFRLFKSGFPT